MEVGQGREQAVPAHPALTAFVHPCTADAEASRIAPHVWCNALSLIAPYVIKNTPEDLGTF